MKKTRFLALFLCLVMLLGIAPLPARAADEVIYMRSNYSDNGGGLFELYDIQVDLMLNLTTLKATLDFRRLSEPQLREYYVKYNPPTGITKERVDRYKENMFGRVTYDIEVLDAPRGDPRLPETLNHDVRVKNGIKWHLTNASGAESVINEVTVTSGTTQIYNHPYEMWIGLDTDGVTYDAHLRDFPDRPNDLAHGWWFKIVDGAPAPEKREYTMGRDNFSFKNRADAFFYMLQGPVMPKIFRGKTFANGTNGILLDETAYEAMMAGRDANQRAALNIMLSQKWEGACAGMSAVSGLLFEGKIGMAQVGAAATAYELKEPLNNPELARFLAFYQISQVFGAKRYTNLNRSNYPSSESSALEMVEFLRSDPESPVVVYFAFQEEPGAKAVWYAHAVLAFKVEEDSGKYKVSVYDPNKPEETRYIYVQKDGKASFLHYGGDIFVRPCTRAKYLYDPKLTYPDVPAAHAVVVADGGVQIVVGGKTATIQNGTVTGDLAVDAEQEYGSDMLTILVPAASGETIRVRNIGGTNASIQTEDTTALITGGVSEVTVNPDGSVTAITNGTEGTLAVASDTTRGDLFGTTVTTSAGEVAITPTANGANVKTSGGTADVTVSGTTQSVGFEDVDTSKGVEIKSSGNSTTLSSDGQEIAKGTASSGGGTTQPATPTQPTAQADTRQIAESAQRNAPDTSQQIVNRRRNTSGTVDTFHSRRSGARYSSWAEKELALADDLNIIPDALMSKLTGNITRKEFAQLVYNTVKASTGMTDEQMAAYAKKPGNAFDSQYSDPAVAFAYGTGIVNGFEDGSFRPDNTITREQAAKMLVVMAELLGKLTSESGAKRFNDAPNNWAQTYINKISSVTSPYSGSRVMGGDQNNNFMPTGTFTTEQAVATMLRMFESVVGEKSGYSGGVIASTTPTTPSTPATPTTPTQTGTTVPTVADNDMTGYAPKDWSWVAEGEGYGREYFTSGKYVRDDGRAVLYIDSSDSYDGFSYQLFVMASGARQSNYTAYDYSNGSSYVWAEQKSDTFAMDSSNGLYFSAGRGYIVVGSDWIDEMYLQYDDPAGHYYLVREKK